MSRAFVTLGVLMVLLIALIVLWTQTGQQHGGAVVIIKQSTIAVLLLLALGMVLGLMKRLLDTTISLDARESLSMRVSEGKDSKRAGQLPAGDMPAPASASMDTHNNAHNNAHIDTQAEIDQIRALIAEDPEKVAQIVKRWIGPSE